MKGIIRFVSLSRFVSYNFLKNYFRDFAVIAAQVGIAGSTQIGSNIRIGGQAGVAGHLLIGDNVTIAAKSGVTKNISDNNVVAGFPAKDINLWKKEVIRNSLKK